MRNRSCLVVLLLTLTAACSEGEDGAKATPADACGPGPYVEATGRVVSYATPTVGIEGAALTSDDCPNLKLVSDADGRFAGKVTKGMKYRVRAEADGYLPLRTGEQVLAADFDGGAPLLPGSMASLLPHWSTDAPTLVVAVVVPEIVDAGAPCGSRAGISISVKNHPEAVVTYFSGTLLPKADPALTATGPLGLAEVSALSPTTAASQIELEVVAPGCDISFTSYPHTGKFPLENGVLTFAGAYMPPIAAP
jgi:hypothetical protein